MMATPLFETPHAENDWPELLPLPEEELPTVPTLPAELLPESFRDWLVDAADRKQVPLEMVAVPALVAVGALVGRTLAIRPKQHDDWTVIPNLWGCIIGRPGVLKSPAVKEAMRHLQRLAAAASEEHRKGATAAKARITDIEAKIKKATQEAGKSDQSAELERLYLDLAAATPIERRYITQDSTVEKFGELLRTNPRGMLLLRDELSGWLRGLVKSGREGDREFYLESWNGDGAYTVDRVGRGTIHIPTLCISVLGTIQPGKIAEYLDAAAKGGVGDDGLVQRLQMTVWPDVGEWQNVDRLPDNEARQRAERVFNDLDALDPASMGVAATNNEVPYLHFTPEAQELFNAWLLDLMGRVRSHEVQQIPAYEAHLAKYPSLMASLALLLQLIDSPDAITVGLEATRKAGGWVEFLEAHARRLYRVTAPEVTAGHALAERIEKHHVRDGNTLRDIQQHGWSGLSSTEGVAGAADWLAAFGWLRVESRRTGGRPSPLLRLHPTLRTVDVCP